MTGTARLPAAGPGNRASTLAGGDRAGSAGRSCGDQGSACRATRNRVAALASRRDAISTGAGDNENGALHDGIQCGGDGCRGEGLCLGGHQQRRAEGCPRRGGQAGGVTIAPWPTAGWAEPELTATTVLTAIPGDGCCAIALAVASPAGALVAVAVEMVAFCAVPVALARVASTPMPGTDPVTLVPVAWGGLTPIPAAGGCAAPAAVARVAATEAAEAADGPCAVAAALASPAVTAIPGVAGWATAVPVASPAGALVTEAVETVAGWAAAVAVARTAKTPMPGTDWVPPAPVASPAVTAIAADGFCAEPEAMASAEVTAIPAVAGCAVPAPVASPALTPMATTGG